MPFLFDKYRTAFVEYKIEIQRFELFFTNEQTGGYFAQKKNMKPKEEEALSNSQKKNFAKIIYLTEEGVTQRELAERVGVTEATMSKWVNTEGWPLLRKSIVESNDNNLAFIHSQIAALRNSITERGEEGDAGLITGKEAETLAKLTGIAKRMETSVGIAQIVSVGKKFVVWLRVNAKERASEFLTLYDAFVKEVVANNGHSNGKG